MDNANKQGKKITAKQIIATAGITTATVGAVILGIKKFKKNTPNELDKQEKEAIKKAEEMKKEEKKVVNNTTNTEPKTVNKEDKKINSYKLANNKYKGNGTRQKVNTSIKTKFIPKKAIIGLPEKSSADEMVKRENEQEIIKLQNKLEKINAIIKINDDKINEINKLELKSKAASRRINRYSTNTFGTTDVSKVVDSRDEDAFNIKASIINKSNKNLYDKMVDIAINMIFDRNGIDKKKIKLNLKHT